MDSSSHFVSTLISVHPSAKSFASARVVEIPERVKGYAAPIPATLPDDATRLEIGLAMRDFTAQIGYDKFLACIYIPTVRAEDSLTVLNGYLPKWLQIYIERSYVEIDPILARQWRSCEPFEWSDLDPREFHPRVGELFMDAMRYGLSSGMSLHLLGRAGSHLFLSFAAGRYRSLGAQREAVFGAALLFGTRALSASVDLIESDPNAILRRLSARQLEALQWAAQGLSMREIGDKIGVAPSTVEYLMRQAQVNLGAGSREEAILHAAQAGLVSRHFHIRVTKSEG